MLIERDWYELDDYHICNGKCRFCAAPIPGYFDNIPGDWGAIRLPLSLSQYHPN